jgi:hypothetical protein
MLAHSDTQCSKAAGETRQRGRRPATGGKAPAWSSKVGSILGLGLLVFMSIPGHADGASSHPDIYRNLVNLCVKVEKKPIAVCTARVRKNLAHLRPVLRNGYWWAGSSGGSPSLALRMVEQMNRQGNTAVFGLSCTSACAIIWNLARRKCLLFGGSLALQQHKADGRGEVVDYRSTDPSYWRRVTRGKTEPSRDLAYYEGTAPKCPEGISISGYRGASKGMRYTDSSPSIFQPPY